MSAAKSCQGRRVVITGAAQGVGKAIAMAAAAAGASAIALVDRDGAGLSLAAGEVRSLGVSVHTFEGDLGDHDFVCTVVPRVLSGLGDVDGLVNAAGVATRTPLLTSDIADWESLFAVNARAPYFLMRDFIAHRAALGGGGSIVNISSMNAKRGIPDLPIYSATKATLDLLTKNIAHSWSHLRIRANAIDAGWLDTPGERQLQLALGKAPDWLDEVSMKEPFGRLMNADDVARLSIFLLGEDSFPMTGSVIDQEQVVAGGRG